MTATAKKAVPKAPGPGNDLQRVTDLLGGPRMLCRSITSPLDAHELLLGGLPGSALNHLVRRLLIIQPDALEKAVGMSLRTFQRRKGATDKLLSQ